MMKRTGTTTEYKRGPFYLAHTVWQDGHEELELFRCVPEQLGHWYDGERVEDVKKEAHSCDPGQFKKVFDAFMTLPEGSIDNLTKL